MPEALKPCPRGCKGTPKIRFVPVETDGSSVDYWRAACECGWAGPMAPNQVEAEAAWNRRESPDTERLDWIIEMFNRPNVSTKLSGLQLGEILAGGLVKGVIYSNARAALDAARKGE